MSNDKIREMGMMAGIAETALDEAVRVRGQSLSLTIQQIVQLRGVLVMLEATADVQLKDIQVALHRMNEAKNVQAI